jgi:hygromycin-B 7''-O-kinase
VDLFQAGLVLRPLWPDVSVTAVVPRTGGQLSSIFELRAADRAVIVKVYDEKWRWKQAKEAHVYRLLAADGVAPVPTILRVEPDTSVIGRAFTVMTRLPGAPLSEAPVDDLADVYRLLAADGVAPVPTILRVEPDTSVIGRAFTVMTRLPGAPLSEAPVDDLADVYRQLGRLVAAIHTVPQPAFGYVTTHVLDPVPDNTTYMGRQFAKKLREFLELRGDPHLHDLVQSYVAAHCDLFARCRTPVLCHNDIHEGNILIEDGKITGLIDVENALAGDPWLDLAKADYYSRRAQLPALLDGYGATPDGRLRLYTVYHALELWDWFASTGQPQHLDSIAADMVALVS